MDLDEPRRTRARTSIRFSANRGGADLCLADKPARPAAARRTQTIAQP